MYLTVKEAHIALDIRFKQLNTNRQTTIPYQIKDLAINRAVRKFIEQRTNKKTNPKREGFEDTQKRYDDIRELLKDEILDSFIHPNYPNLVYSVLPKDYFKLISDRSSIYWDCNTLNNTSSSSVTKYSVLQFLDDNTSGAATSYYSNFNLNINGVLYSIPELSMIEKMNSADAKFTLIHTIIDSVNNRGQFNIYWERYDDKYYYNSFIVTSGTTVLTSAQITYLKKDNTTFTGAVVVASDITRYKVDVPETTVIRPNELTTTDIFWDMINNYYYTKNRQNKPISFLEQNRLITHHNPDFIVAKTHIQYIKTPTLVNLKLNQSCELSKMEEIIELAAIELYAISGDPNYKTMINENLTAE